MRISNVRSLLALLLSAASFPATGANWVQTGEAVHTVGDESFGTSIALSDKNLVVGSPYQSDSTYGEESEGVVRIYDRPDPTSFKLKDELTGGAKDETMGAAVDISSNSETIVVGAPHEDGGVNTAHGKVRIFRINRKNGGEGYWDQVGKDLVGSDTDPDNDRFGQSVSISDDGLVVCIGSGDPTEDSQQKVDVYKDNGEDFVFMGQIRVPGRENAVALYGVNVDIVQNEDLDEYYIAISSARYSTGKGIVMVFKLDNDHANRNKNKDSDAYEWLMMGRSIIGKNNHEELGKSISLGIFDNILHLAVGVPEYNYYTTSGDELDLDSGAPSNSHVAVYRFDTSVDKGKDPELIEWELVQAFEQLEDDDGTGEAVAISRDGLRIAVGSPKYQRYKGMVRVFDFHKRKDKFLVVGESLFAGDSEFNGFGEKLALSGLELAVSAPYGNYVKIFKYDGETIYENGSGGGSSFGRFIVVTIIIASVAGILTFSFIQLRERGYSLASMWPERFSSSHLHTPSVSSINANERQNTGGAGNWPISLRGSSTRVNTSDHDVVLHGMPNGRVSTEDNIGDGDYDLEMKQIS